MPEYSYQTQIHRLQPDQNNKPTEKVGFARCQVICEQIARRWDEEKTGLLAKIDELQARVMKGKL